MFNRHTSASKKIPVVLAFLGVLAVTAVAGRAHAASTSGTLTQVEFNAGTPAWPLLILQISSSAGVNFFAQQPSPSPSCFPAMSADSIKAFISIAQGAFLAGKNVTIYYTPCVGNNYIYDIVMSR